MHAHMPPASKLISDKKEEETMNDDKNVLMSKIHAGRNTNKRQGWSGCRSGVFDAREVAVEHGSPRYHWQ